MIEYRIVQVRVPVEQTGPGSHRVVWADARVEPSISDAVAQRLAESVVANLIPQP